MLVRFLEHWTWYFQSCVGYAKNEKCDFLPYLWVNLCEPKMLSGQFQEGNKVLKSIFDYLKYIRSYRLGMVEMTHNMKVWISPSILQLSGHMRDAFWTVFDVE